MRKVLNFKIEKEGRDKGKLFQINEMSAVAGDRWATKALFAIAKGDVVIPESISGSGFAGIAKLGLQMLLLAPYELCEPLLMDLLACVKVIPNPKDMNIVRDLIDADIEEFSTYADLREQAFKLHVDFFTQGEPSTSA